MNQTALLINEQQAAAAFDKQAAIFDELYSRNTIIQYKRDRVRRHVQERINPGTRILELNAGTGEDAIYFARNGYHIHATDISNNMLAKLEEKQRKAGLEDFISLERCSYSALDQLHEQGPFDMIFSNFAGINCCAQLESILHQFGSVVKPGGLVTMVIMPPFCLWEVFLLFRGKFQTAFRRFFSQKGRMAHIEGAYFKCWYYRPKDVIRHLGKEFELESLEGLCSIVPPSYLEGFAEKHPKLYRILEKAERKLKGNWPWKNIGDYFIISLRKCT